jgi:hypothetical protein
MNQARSPLAGPANWSTANMGPFIGGCRRQRNGIGSPGRMTAMVVVVVFPVADDDAGLRQGPEAVALRSARGIARNPTASTFSTSSTNSGSPSARSWGADY